MGYKDIRNARKRMMGLDDALVATKGGVFLLRSILSFWRKRAVRNIESSEELLNIKEEGMDYFLKNQDLPVVNFRIKVEKKIYLKLQLEKLLLELSCDNIPLKTFYWDRRYNIDEVRLFQNIKGPDIEVIGNGYIDINYPCVNVFYNHSYIHMWELNGKLTFHSKIGDINKEITLKFQLGDGIDKKKEEKFKKAIEHFQKFYVEGGYKPVS